MAYHRILYLTLSVGFGSLLYKSIPNSKGNNFKINKGKPRLHGQIRILNTNKSTTIYKPFIDKWWERFVKVYAQQNDKNEPCKESEVENDHLKTSVKENNNRDSDTASSSKSKCDKLVDKKVDSVEDNGGTDDKDGDKGSRDVCEKATNELLDEDADEDKDGDKGSRDVCEKATNELLDEDDDEDEDDESEDYDDDDDEAEAECQSDSDDQEIENEVLDIDTPFGCMTVFLVVPMDSHNESGRSCPPHSPKSTADQIEPTRTIVQHDDVFVVAESRTKTAWWSIEKINECTVDKVEHYHLEALDIQCTLPCGVELGRSDNEARPLVQALLRPRQHEVNGQLVCDRCKNTKFWKVFHQYLAFLTEMYANVYVCSGCIFLDSVHPRRPTHFFKVISCRNRDGTFRFECYKIGTQQRHLTTPKLSKYIISREQLCQETGVRLFEHVPSNMIKERSTHPLFVYCETEPMVPPPC